MARLPALIDAFVRTDGRDRSTIEHVARVIREHGLIPTTKRGTGAAAMTAREAVNLLFALNGASSPKDSVEAVQRLRLMSRYDSGYSADPCFDALRNITGLGEAIEYLINSFPAILKFFGLSLHNLDEYTFDAFNVAIEIHRTRAEVSIRGDSPAKYLFRASYRLGFEAAEKYLVKNFDRRVVSYLSANTIHSLWHCLSDSYLAEDD